MISYSKSLDQLSRMLVHPPSLPRQGGDAMVSIQLRSSVLKEDEPLNY